MVSTQGSYGQLQAGSNYVVPGLFSGLCERTDICV